MKVNIKNETFLYSPVLSETLNLFVSSRVVLQTEATKFVRVRATRPARFKAKTWRFNGFSLQAKQNTFSQSNSVNSLEPENLMIQFESEDSCSFLDAALAFLFSDKVKKISLLLFSIYPSLQFLLPIEYTTYYRK